MYNKFVAEGDKLAQEILTSGPPVEWVVATPEWLDSTSLTIPEDQLLLASERELNQLSNLKTPQGVLVVADCLPEPEPPFFFPDTWALYLDDIQDPGNMGTMLRIANWFGVTPVIVSPQSADSYNPKVVQASMGSVWRVPVLRKRLDDCIRDEQIPVYAADMHGSSVFTPEGYKPGIVIIGNEGRGLSDEWRPYINDYLSIPRGKGGGGESLNAAVACGIMLAALTAK